MKIDTSTIQGYAEMTPEQKLAALENLELNTPDMTQFVSKNTADKYASEAASLKKQLRERMTAEEQQEAERKQLMEDLNRLRREQAIDRSTARLTGMKMSPSMASKLATALLDGDMEAIYDHLGKFMDDREKVIRAELLRETPEPPAGKGTKSMTLEEFRKLGLSEKTAFAEEHPEEYKNLYGG